MIQHPSFRVEPWSLHETALSLDVLAQTESLFALSNGHIGLRGNLDEGEPHGLPGTYLNGFYELRPLPSAESQYGAPESSQTLIDVTNGKLIRLLVDDEPFDVRYGQLRAHDRVLDFRAGTLTRTAEWCSPARRTRARDVDAVRLVHPSRDHGHRLRGRAARRARQRRRAVRAGGQRAAPVVARRSARGRRASSRRSCPRSTRRATRAALLIHRTRRSGLRMAAAMDHVITGTPALHVVTETSVPDSARVVATDVLEPGQRLRLVKLVAYGWSHERTQPALRDQVAAALVAAQQRGLGRAARRAARATSTTSGQRGDVELEGDPELQQAVRFALFQVLSAGARAEGARHPRQGADRHRLRRPLVLGHRPLRRPGAHLHRARGRRGRAALAPLDAADAAQGARARPRPGGRRVSLAHHPRRGVLGLLAGRDGGVPRQRRHRRRRSSSTCTRPATTRSSATRASTSSSRRRGCGARSGTTTSTAASASTASPAPTSTAPSPTTTSTRT